MNRSENDPVPVPERSNRARGNRRVRMAAFGISAALHLLALLLYAGGATEWVPRAAQLSSPEASGEPPLDGTRIVNLVEVDPSEPEIASPAQPEPEPEPVEEEEEEEPDLSDLPAAPSEAPGEGIAPEEGDGLDPIPAAEVFRLRVKDPTLWVVARPDLLLLSPEQRQQLEIAGRLEAWNDSINAAMAADAAALDWTRSDGDGGKWGVSPGKLHLGKLTLPLPFGFGPNPWQAEQIAERQARDADIAFHAQSQAVRASWKERAEAIRERKDRERAREREREAGSDTTRSRGGGGGG